MKPALNHLTLLLFIGLSACAGPQRQLDRALANGDWQTGESLLQAHGSLVIDAESRLALYRATGQREAWLTTLDAARDAARTSGGEVAARPWYTSDLLAYEQECAFVLRQADRWLSTLVNQHGEVTLAEDEFAFGLEALQTVAGRVPETLLVLTRVLFSNADVEEVRVPGSWEQLEAATLDAVSRTLYLRRYATVESLLALMQEHPRTQTSRQQAYAAWALESRARREGDAALQAADSVTLLQWATRWEQAGLSRAAGTAWRVLAEQRSGNDAAIAWRSAADALYAAGETDAAREALQFSVESATDKLLYAQSTARTAQARGDIEWGLEHLASTLDVRTCASSDPESQAVLDAEWQWAAMRLAQQQSGNRATTPSPERVRQVQHRSAMLERVRARMAQCNAETLVLQVAQALHGIGQESEAHELLMAQFDAYGGSYSLFGVWFEQPLTDAEAADIASRLEIWLATLPDEIPDDSLRFLVGVLTNRREAAIVEVRNRWLQAELTSPRVQLPLALVQARYLQEADLFDERRQLLEEVIEAQENPIQARAQVARWMVSWAESDEAAQFATELAQRPDAVVMLEDISEAEAISIRQYAWRLALTASVESGDAPSVLRTALAWAQERGADEPDTWRYLWTLRTVWEVLGPEERVEFAQRSDASGYCPPEMREDWGFALASQGNFEGATEVLLPLLNESQERQDGLVGRILEEWDPGEQQRFSAVWRAQHGETVAWRRAQVMALARRLQSRTASSEEAREQRLFLIAEIRAAVRELRDVSADDLPPAVELLSSEPWLIRDLYATVPADESTFVTLMERIESREAWSSLESDLLAFVQDAERSECQALIRSLSSMLYGTEALPVVRTILYRFRSEDGGSNILRTAAPLLTLTLQTAPVEAFIRQEILVPATLLSQGVREFGPNWAWRHDTAEGAQEFLSIAMDYAHGIGHWALALECIDRLMDVPRARNRGLLELAFRTQALHRAGAMSLDDVTFWIAKSGGEEEVWIAAIQTLFRIRLVELAARVLAVAPDRVRLDPSLIVLQLLLPDEFQTSAPVNQLESYLIENPDLNAAEIGRFLKLVWEQLQGSQYVDRMDALLEVCRSRAGTTRDFIEVEGSLLVARGDMVRAAQLFQPRGSTSVAGSPALLEELGIPTLAMRALDEQANQLPLREYLNTAWDLQSEIRPRIGTNAWNSHVRTFSEQERSATANPASMPSTFRLNFRYAATDAQGALDILGEQSMLLDEYQADIGLLHAYLDQRDEVRRWLRSQPPSTSDAFEAQSRLQIMQLAGGTQEFASVPSVDDHDHEALLAIWVAIYEGRESDALTYLENNLFPRLLSEPGGWFASSAPLGETGLRSVLHALATSGYAHECVALLRRWLATSPQRVQLLYEAVWLALQFDLPEKESLTREWLQLAEGSPELQAALMELVADSGRLEIMGMMGDADTVLPALSDPSVQESVWKLAIAEQWWLGESTWEARIRQTLLERGVSESEIQLVVPTWSTRSFLHAPEASLPARLALRSRNDSPWTTQFLQDAVSARPGVDIQQFLLETSLMSRESGNIGVQLLYGIEPETDAAWHSAALEMAIASQLDSFDLLLNQLPLAAQSESGRFEEILAELLPTAVTSNALLLRLLTVLNGIPDRGAWHAVGVSIEQEGASKEVCWQAATLAHRAEDDDAAIFWVNRALDDEQDNFAILAQYGAMLLDLRQFQILDSLVERVEAEWPANTITEVWRGLIVVQREGLDNAASLLNLGVQELEAFDEPSQTVLRLLIQAGAFEQAQMLSDRLAGLVFPIDGRLDFPGLSDVLRVWAELAPEQGLAWYEEHWAPRLGNGELLGRESSLCELFIAAGQPERAELLLTHLHNLNPDNPVAMNNLAWYWAERGERLEEAELLARRAVVLENASNANTIDTLAWVRFQQGSIEEAIDMQRYALRLAATEFAPDEPWRLEVRAALLDHYRAMQAALTPVDQSGAETRRSRRERRRDSN